MLRLTQPFPGARRQHGAALIVGVLLLLVITMLGLTSIRGTSLQERMAGNARDRSQSFNAAETALRAGETQALNQAANDFTGGNAGLYEIDSNPAPDPASSANWTATAVIPTSIDITAPVLGGAAQTISADRWIEKHQNQKGPGLEIPAIHDIEVFRIAARSTGPSGTAEVILETSFKR